MERPINAAVQKTQIAEFDWKYWLFDLEQECLVLDFDSPLNSLTPVHLNKAYEMKYQTTIITTAIALSLAACGDSGKQQSQPSATAPAHAYVKATKERPSSIPATLSNTEPCAIDTVNEQLSQLTNLIADKAKVKLVGWAGDVVNGTSPQEVWVELVGANTMYVKAVRGGKRADVASHFNKPGLIDAGWESHADLTGLAAGNYKLRVVMFDGNQGLACDSKLALQIN